MDDWASFRKKGKKYSEKLEVLKPDIVAKLNEEFRKEEERKGGMEEKRKKQIYKTRRQEGEMLQAEMEKDRKLAKERRKQKQDQLKAAMKIPVAKLPEKEMCEYEKLRERNINERKKAMIEAGFFEDLNSYKHKIGMITTDSS